MRDIIEYQKLFWQTFRDDWKSSLKTWEVIVTILSSVVPSILFIWSNGWSAVLDEYKNFLLSTFLLPGILATLYSVYFLLNTPAKLLFSEKKKADLYTVSGIEIDKAIPDIYDVIPCGIKVTNKKNVDIKSYTNITRVWQDRTEIGKGSLPKDLRWYLEDGTLVPSYQTIEQGKYLIIALEHVKTEIEKGAIVLHAQSTSGEKVDYGKSVGLEFGGELGMSVFERLPLRVEIQFFFIINGLYLKPKHHFMLLLNDGKLIANKIGDWILDDQEI